MSRRILWVGDAATATGFANCTHAVCDLLHESGWDVFILGINYDGDPHKYDYSIYPCFRFLDVNQDFMGVYRLGHVMSEVDPDVVVFLNDPWNVPNYITALQFWSGETGKLIPPTVGWLAVDGKNQPKGAVNSLHRVVTWTEFGAQEIRNSGYCGPIDVVPLGVDHNIFKPLDRLESRAKVIVDRKPISDDDFIVGFVGRNQIRKRIDLTIQAFAEFISRYSIDDAKLLIHSAPTGEDAFDLHRLADYYGVKDKMILSEGVLGSGLDISVLPVLYSSMDVFLTTTQGEGWGLCVLEAMACGIPCITPNWSGLGDWAEGVSLSIPCKTTAVSAPIGSGAYTIGGVADIDSAVSALEMLYDEPSVREDYSNRGLSLASTLTWKRTAQEFKKVLEGIDG